MNKKINTFQLDKISLKKIYDSSDINTYYYGFVFTDKFKDGACINLSLMLLETELGKCKDWDEFNKKLTDYLITSYRINSIPGFNFHTKTSNNQAINISLMNYDGFNIEYTNIKDPSVRNQEAFKHRLTDLVISKNKNCYEESDLKNCLVSVNGIMTYPIFFKDELYLIDGARYLWSCNKNRIPDMVMIDTSPIGGHQIIKFNECEKIYNYPNNLKNPKVDIEYILPVDLTNKTVMMVYGHTLYYPDEIKIVSNKSVVISPYTLPLNISLLMIQEASINFEYNTEVVISQYTIDEYITTISDNKDHNGAYFIVIDNPDVYVNRYLLGNDIPHHTKIHWSDKGILKRNSTRALVDYVEIPHSNGNVINFSPAPHMFKTDSSFYNTQIGSIKFTCAHNDFMKDLADSSYEMIYLIS